MGLCGLNLSLVARFNLFPDYAVGKVNNSDGLTYASIANFGGDLGWQMYATSLPPVGNEHFPFGENVEPDA